MPTLGSLNKDTEARQKAAEMLSSIFNKEDPYLKSVAERNTLEKVVSPMEAKSKGTLSLSDTGTTPLVRQRLYGREFQRKGVKIGDQERNLVRLWSEAHASGLSPEDYLTAKDMETQKAYEEKFRADAEKNQPPLEVSNGPGMAVPKNVQAAKTSMTPEKQFSYAKLYDKYKKMGIDFSRPDSFLSREGKGDITLTDLAENRDLYSEDDLKRMQYMLQAKAAGIKNQTTGLNELSVEPVSMLTKTQRLQAFRRQPEVLAALDAYEKNPNDMQSKQVVYDNIGKSFEDELNTGEAGIRAFKAKKAREMLDDYIKQYSPSAETMMYSEILSKYGAPPKAVFKQK